MIRYGKCINIDEDCVNAKSGKVIEIDGAKDFICPECKNELFEVPPPPKKGTLDKILGVIAFLFLVGILVWAFWPKPPIETVKVKSWDCQTGILSLTSTGGNGGQVLYKVEGLALIKNNNEFIIPSSLRNGKVLSFIAIQDEDQVVNSFTTTCTDLVPLTLQADSDCQTRLITLTTTGGDKSPIVYSAESLKSPYNNNVFKIPDDQPVGITLKFQAVQNGKQVNIQYEIDCKPIEPKTAGDGKQSPKKAIWTRVLNSDFCEPGTCTLLYSETDNLGHTRERRIDNYAKCCPVKK